MDFKAFGFEELCDKLCENRKTLIIYHSHPDADAIGSAFALRELLTMMGIQTICACEDEVPARLSFLTEDVQGGVVLARKRGSLDLFFYSTDRHLYHVILRLLCGKILKCHTRFA